MSNPVYSFVIPVHNEEETLGELYRELAPVLEQLDGPAEVILVNDGSTDSSYAVMLQIQDHDSRFKVIDLSRNFGHQVAITVGLDYVSGDATVIMDADLQDPPELVLDMAGRWREGFEIVYGIREVRTEDTWFKRTSARAFYRFLGRVSDVKLPPDVGDFRLVDRKVVLAIRRLPERARYLRGMFGWVGFKQVGIPYARRARIAGTTKYPVGKMIRLATDALISFSSAPLKLALSFGFVISGLSFLAGVAALILKATGAFTVPGWASIVAGVAFLGGMQLLVLGVMGEYVARIYDEVKRRPLYVIRATHGIDAPVIEPLREPREAPAERDEWVR